MRLIQCMALISRVEASLCFDRPKSAPRYRKMDLKLFDDFQ